MNPKGSKSGSQRLSRTVQEFFEGKGIFLGCGKEGQERSVSRLKLLEIECVIIGFAIHPAAPKDAQPF